MARKLNFIMEITAQKEAWKVSVCVCVCVWIIQRAAMINIEMILMDEKV